MKRTALIVTAALWGGTSLFADFSYEQTSKVTGGMMGGMMRTFSKQARETKTSIMVKGSRMATLSATSGQIIDLGKETITQVDFQKKTYSVLTFAQFAEALSRMNARIKGAGRDEGMEMTVKPSVKETGQKRTVAGLDSRQVILTIEMEGTDKNGKKVTGMAVSSDMWISSNVAGYGEVRDFYKQMMAKMNWTPAMGMTQAPGAGKGMAELVKEMSKLDGVPVLQVVKIGAPAGQPSAEGSEGAAPQQSPQTQEAQAAKPSVSDALGKLGGRFGGLGGFGRKKKQQEEQPAPAASSESAPPPASQPAAPQGAPSLLEMTSELSDFSAASVDGSKLEIPAGFKQVESEMLKLRD
jgi:hypothetical protein